MKISLATLLVLISLPSAAFAQGVEVPMTPTPTPTPPPKVAPIPTYPEKGGDAAGTTTGGAAANASKVHVDAGGMFGVGVAAGNTCTGVAGKYWVGRDIAVQFSGGTFPDANHFREQLDVLFVIGRYDEPEGNYSLPFYVGLGGQMSELPLYKSTTSRFDIGARLPFGMSVVVPDNPVELFFEIAPDLAAYTTKTRIPIAGGPTFVDKQSGLAFTVDGQIGARYYF